MLNHLLLALSLFSFSISGPAIRLANAPALAIVVWRIGLAWPLLAGTALIRRKAWPLMQGMVAGIFLALHWICWVLAVQRTSIASASLLICTGALWSALLSRPILGEPISRRQWYGLALALFGVSLVMIGKPRAHHSSLGDLLALCGSFAWLAYSFIGRRARKTADFWAYTATVYLAAGGVVLVMALAQGGPLARYDGITWTALAVLALFPTLLGHGIFNYLLRFIGPARLGLWGLAEPVLATFWAWPLFGEVPSILIIIGGLLTVVGVGLGIREGSGRRGPKEMPTPSS